MRVIINGTAAIKPRTGIGHYTAGLYEALLRVAGRADAFHLYPRPWQGRAAGRAYRWVSAGGGTVAPRRARSAGGRVAVPAKRVLHRLGLLACQGHFRGVCRPGRFDLYHEPNVIPWPADVPAVATVHDLSVLRFPNWHPAARVGWYEKHFFPGLARCRHVITDSEFVRRELIEHLGFRPDRVTAIHIGLRDRFRPLPREEVGRVLARLGLPAGYLLYVGTLEPRKNLLTLARAYCALPGHLREGCPLVLCGGWGWNAGELRAFYEETARHRGVIHLGYVPDEDLPALYNGARALVYPSFYEGFGLPPLEMMRCGGAVLASSAGVHREVLGGHGRLIDPEDTDAWRDGLRQAAGDDAFLAALRRGALEWASRFTWERCAEETIAVYRRVAGS